MGGKNCERAGKGHPEWVGGEKPRGGVRVMLGHIWLAAPSYVGGLLPIGKEIRAKRRSPCLQAAWVAERRVAARWMRPSSRDEGTASGRGFVGGKSEREAGKVHPEWVGGEKPRGGVRVMLGHI